MAGTYTMKHTISGALCLALALSGCGGGDSGGAKANTPAPIQQGSPPPATPAPSPAASLPAPQTDRLRVAYIGGSITEGAFSSVPERSYASRLTQWLGTRYREVEARNLGVGGTGSDFAAYRMQHDLAGFAPDLAFLEFTVNDAGTPRAAIIAHLDAVIYRLRQANPRVKVVYISTTDIGEEADRRAGRRANFVEEAAAAAAYLDLPFIDAAKGLWARVIAGEPVRTYIEDSVHPNDAGHQLYFEAVRDALADTIPLAVQPSVASTRLIERSGLGNARLEPGTAASGCRPGTLKMRYMDAALACDQGDAFTFRFSGTTVGLVRAMVRDGGRLACTLDGGSPTTADFYDAVTPIYERAFPIFLYRDLAAGSHVLSCRATGDIVSGPQGSSAGHKATVGHFMVGDERPLTL